MSEEVKKKVSEDQLLDLVSLLVERALNYTNNTIRDEVDSSIEEQEKAIQQIQDGETEEAVETLSDNIQYMMERSDMWKLHMEDLGDPVVEGIGNAYDSRRELIDKIDEMFVDRGE